jgi:single-strand DNA-binding protein
MSINKAILIGRLTKDPVKRVTPNKISVTSFTIAVDRNYKDKEGKRQTDFIPVITWNKTADLVAQYCTKGKLVAVIGSIQTRSYDDKNGVKRYVTEVIADQVEFLSPKQNGKEEQSRKEEDIEFDDFQPVGDEDVPF